MIPVVDHALLVITLAGEHLVPANIDRGVWHTGLVQKPMEIGILDKPGVIDLVRC